jgi:hypothetical protein
MSYTLYATEYKSSLGKETMMNLDDITDEEYYGALKTLFKTEGWKVVIAELEDQASLIADLQTIKTDRELCYKQGQLSTIGYLMNFEETIATAEKEAEEDLEANDD